MRLKDKKAIITGGAGGIGKAITIGFLKEGASVAIVDNNDVFIDNGEREELFRHNSVVFVRADVSDSGEVGQMVNQVIRKFNKIDILVNCAGIYEYSTMLNMNDEEWDKTLRVNLYSCFYCSRAVGACMREQRSGSIINLSSIAGMRAASMGHSHYGASKAGIIGFTRAIAAELGPFGIRANCICPGLTVGTPMGNSAQNAMGEEYLKRVPLGRFAIPQDIAYGATYLASDESNYITGACLNITGGMHMD